MITQTDTCCPFRFNRTGGFNPDKKIQFGLTPESVGDFLHELPDSNVHFVRDVPVPEGASGEVTVEKVFRITTSDPYVHFNVGFELEDEVDEEGQSAGDGPPMVSHEVTTTVGNYMVIRELMQRSLPALTGWDVQLNHAVQNAMNVAVSQNGSDGGQ
jgi:hypothetical protein